MKCQQIHTHTITHTWQKSSQWYQSKNTNVLCSHHSPLPARLCFSFSGVLHGSSRKMDSPLFLFIAMLTPFYHYNRQTTTKNKQKNPRTTRFAVDQSYRATPLHHAPVRFLPNWGISSLIAKSGFIIILSTVQNSCPLFWCKIYPRRWLPHAPRPTLLCMRSFAGCHAYVCWRHNPCRFTWTGCPLFINPQLFFFKAIYQGPGFFGLSEAKGLVLASAEEMQKKTNERKKEEEKTIILWKEEYEWWLHCFIKLFHPCWKQWWKNFITNRRILLKKKKKKVVWQGVI